MLRLTLPEVSTRPPLPPWAPPRARIRPSMRVLPSDQTTARPPLPLPVAETSMLAPLASVAFFARGSSPRPWKSPPMRTLPPCAAPRASMRAVLARATCCPLTSTSPPFFGPLTSILPATWMSPDLLTSATLPSRTSVPRARITPDRLTALSTTREACSAVISTLPPSAWIAPPLLTSAWASCGLRVTGSVTAIDTRPSP